MSQPGRGRNADEPGGVDTGASVASSADGLSAPPRRGMKEAIRARRRDLGMTQADLGAAVEVSRYIINRLESGAIDLDETLAARISAALKLPSLMELFEQQRRDNSSMTNERNAVVERILHKPDIETLSVVVVDDLDIYQLIYNSREGAALLNARKIDVIFPTIARESELFHGQPLIAHIEYQIKRLADLQGSDYAPFDNLTLYESDNVINSVVSVTTRTGSECAYWAPILAEGGVDGAHWPVVASADPAVTGRIDSYVYGLIRENSPMHTNEALCRVSARADQASPNARFTRYFQVGEDQEDDVDSDEGFAVSLVLAFALCPRRRYGVGKRVVMYRRPITRHDRGRLSLFSNNVDDDDIRMARDWSGNEAVAAARQRSRKSATAAAIEINDYLIAQAGQIPDLAYQIAASREFRMFGLTVRPERIQPIPLPAELSMISKGKKTGPVRASVAPRLFALELSPAGGEPELDVLSSRAEIELIGLDDIVEDDGRLNDFLLQARDSGFLLPVLRDLEVVER